MLCTFTGMVSITSNSKLRNLITSCKLLKTPKNFVEISHSMKLTKLTCAYQEVGNASLPEIKCTYKVDGPLYKNIYCD